jgi:hypothetical protein
VAEDERRLQRAPEVLWRRSGERHLLLCGRDQEPILLEGVGSAVWQLLAEPIGPRELEATLAEHYGVPAEMVAAELAPFLARLEEVGAVARR